MYKSRNHISIVLLLPVILLFQFVQLGNVHYHKLANGSVVKHAHIYKDVQDSSQPNSGKHTHNNAELLILQFFDANSDDYVSTIISIEPPEFSQNKSGIQIYQLSYSIFYSHFGLRAPPIV